MCTDAKILRQQKPEERIATLKGLLAEQFSGITQLLKELPPETRTALERKVVVADLLAKTIFDEMTPSR